MDARPRCHHAVRTGAEFGRTRRRFLTDVECAWAAGASVRSGNGIAVPRKHDSTEPDQPLSESFVEFLSVAKRRWESSVQLPNSNHQQQASRCFAITVRQDTQSQESTLWRLCIPEHANRQPKLVRLSGCDGCAGYQYRHSLVAPLQPRAVPESGVPV